MAMIAIGLVRALLGDAPVAESAGYGIHAEQVGLTGLAMALLALRAFSSGCTALTGVEAISNGVPAFRKPKAQNAARTMAAMGVAGDHHVRRDHRAGVDRRTCAWWKTPAT